MSTGKTQYFQPTAMQPTPYDPNKPTNTTDINALNYPGQGMQDVPTPFDPATTIYGAGPNSRTQPYNGPGYPPGTRVLYQPSNGIGGGSTLFFDAEGKPIGGMSLSGMGGGGRAPTPSYAPAAPTPSYAPAAPAWGTAPTAPALGAASGAPAWGAAPTAPAWGAAPTAPAWGAAPTAPAWGAAPGSVAFGAAPGAPQYTSAAMPQARAAVTPPPAAPTTAAVNPLSQAIQRPVAQGMGSFGYGAQAPPWDPTRRRVLGQGP